MNRTQVITMLNLQDRMNRKVHEDWQNQGFEWYRAIWVECAELMDHYGWKWWKKQDPDWEQVKLEVIDIWHFGMSHLLQGAGTLDHIADHIVEEFSGSAEKKEFREALETFTEWTLTNRDFSVANFYHLMTAAELSFDELYIGYIGKNVLNFFRQDHGYKDGTYIKVWDGREDNEHLVEISGELDVSSDSFYDDLYVGLKNRYEALAS